MGGGHFAPKMSASASKLFGYLFICKQWICQICHNTGEIMEWAIQRRWNLSLQVSGQCVWGKINPLLVDLQCAPQIFLLVLLKLRVATVLLVKKEVSMVPWAGNLNKWHVQVSVPERLIFKRHNVYNRISVITLKVMVVTSKGRRKIE